MRGIAMTGVIIGCLAMLAGGILVLMALLGDFSDLDWRVRGAARQAQATLGLTGALSGFAFVLAAHILHAVQETQERLAELAQATRRATSAEPPATRGAAISNPRWEAPREVPPTTDDSPPRWDGPSLPPRIEMVQRHGEAVGGRAWDLIRAAQRQGGTLTEREAVRAAREEQQGGQG